MATPFYAEFVSWYLAIVLAVPLLFLGVLYRRKPSLPHYAITPMLLLLFLHGGALVYSDTQFEYQVIKDIIISSFVLFIYFLADEDTESGFFSALIFLGTITALIGLMKAAFLDRGYLLGFILDSCHYYPAGSALCVNYNNLGLLWLIASLGCLRNRWWLLLPILISAGLLSSSRRFIVLAAFLPVVWILVEGRAAIIKSIIIGVLVVLMVHFVTDPVSFEHYRFGEKEFKVLFEIDEDIGYDNHIQINRSLPSVMLGTMTDGTFGTASRLDYWKLAFNNLSWLPQGWSYHEIFSCQFSDCSEFHYPHMSIMSAWLIGGVLFGLIAITFYAWPTWVIWRQGSVIHIAVLLFALPYSLISGDTVFSLAIYLACMLVALSSVRRRSTRYLKSY